MQFNDSIQNRKKTFKASFLWRAIFIGIFVLMSSLLANADDDHAQKVYQELCSNGSAEGSYVVFLKPIGRFRINIVCEGPSSLAASFREIGEVSGVNNSFVHTAIDGDIINFVTFHVSEDDAKTMSSEHLDLRLKLSISSLKKGILNGIYKTTNLIDPVSICANRESAFPNLLLQSNHSIDYRQMFVGSFAVSDSKLKMIMYADIVGGIQRININFPEINGLVLYNGLEASSAGNVFYATSGVDDGTFGKTNLFHIRGRVVNQSELEVFYLDTQKGLIGPLRAIRR